MLMHYLAARRNPQPEWRRKMFFIALGIGLSIALAFAGV
jgi:hypothetical protein